MPGESDVVLVHLKKRKKGRFSVFYYYYSPCSPSLITAPKCLRFRCWIMLVVLPCHAKLDLQRLQTAHALVLYNVKCFQTFDHFCLNVRFAIICDYDDSLQPCFKKNKSLQRSLHWIHCSALLAVQFTSDILYSFSAVLNGGEKLRRSRAGTLQLTY